MKNSATLGETLPTSPVERISVSSNLCTQGFLCSNWYGIFSFLGSESPGLLLSWETPQSPHGDWLSLLPVRSLCLIRGGWLEAEGGWRSLCPLCIDRGRTAVTTTSPGPSPSSMPSSSLPPQEVPLSHHWGIKRGAGGERSSATWAHSLCQSLPRREREALLECCVSLYERWRGVCVCDLTAAVVPLISLSLYQLL